jgi:hypothetical protein
MTAFNMMEFEFDALISQRPPETIDHFPEFFTGCMQHLGIVQQDGTVSMVFYDTINAIDIPLAFGTLVALPNFSFVANKKAVTVRSGVILIGFVR